MTLRTLTRGALAALAATALLAPAAAADVVLTPEQRALLDPTAVPNPVHETQQVWTAGVLRTGTFPGVPGNNHVASVTVRYATGPGVTDQPQVTVDLTDSQCDATCTTLRTAKGTVVRPDGLDLPLGGAAQMRLTITDQTPGMAITRAPGVPADPLTTDATIAPSTPLATQVTVENALVIVRSQSATEGRHTATGPSQLVPAVPSGSLFGIPLAEGTTGGNVSLSVRQTAALPTLPLVRTPAQRRPWLPAVADGRITDDGEARANRSGFLAAAPVTSTGHTPEGNRHRLMVHAQARPDGSSLVAYLDSKSCAPGQVWTDCAELPDYLVLTARGTPTVRVAANGTLTVNGAFSVAPGSVAGSDPDAWGVLRVRGTWAPGAVGAPQHDVVLYRIGGESFREERALSYRAGDATATAPRSTLTIGGVAVAPPSEPALEFDDLTYAHRTLLE